MMIFNGDYCIYVLLCVSTCIAANNVGNIFLNFTENIRGISVYGTDTFGVALDKEVYVGRFQDEDNTNPIEISRIPIDIMVSVDPLLEFKLINETTVLACTSDGCSVCLQHTESYPKCFRVPLPRDGKLSSVSATFANDDIILRAVRQKDDAFNASIYHFVPNVSDQIYEHFGRQADDEPENSQVETVASFSTPKYSYFVGSAKQKGIHGQFNDAIVITRICNNDKTACLASRTDLTLSCEDIDYEKSDGAVFNKATAATYLHDSSRLLVAFQNGPSGNENYICNYNFTELQSKFVNRLKSCQGTTNTRENFQFDNCEMHVTEENSNASIEYSTLEHLRPYRGNVVFEETHSEPIVSVREEGGSLYAVRGDNQVIRLVKHNQKLSVFTPIPGKSGKHMFEVLSTGNKVLFIPTGLEKSVSYFSSSCEGLYKTCKSINWNDPMQCAFCANNDGTGVVMDYKTTCSDNRVYKNICPPTITEAMKTELGEYFISGTDFDKFLADLEVRVCDALCNMTLNITPTSIHCSTGMPSIDNCVVIIEGSLSLTHENITLSKLLQQNSANETTVAPSSDKTKSSSLFWKVVLFVIAVIGLPTLICIIYICLTRNANTRYQRVNSEIQLKLIPERLNPNDLIVLKSQPLGKGFSAIVYKGSFKTSNEYISVAVKMFYESYHPLMDNDETIDELKVLRRVQHSNIVGFIGHVYIEQTLHIVTEYMGGGSLYDFMKDEANVLKYQHTFDYMDQILSAMVYLTKQHIVHRDLAARNCLLNTDHTVLKVSDFGLARTANIDGEYLIVHKDTFLPGRWIAIEVFQLKSFTEKSDVWSFGVLVWELFTRGETPYTGMEHNEIPQFLDEGYRLYCPEGCPEEIYSAMISCWDIEPAKRPTFKQLHKEMIGVIHNLLKTNQQFVDTEYYSPHSKQFTHGSKTVTVV